MSNTLRDVLSMFGLVGEDGSSEEEMLTLVSEWQAFFTEEYGTLDISAENLSLLEVSISSLLESPNQEAKLALIEEASENPLVGLALLLVSIPGLALRQGGRWWNLFFAEPSLGSTEGWDIKELPAPEPGDPEVEEDKGTKYLIISDLHRDDADRDDLGPFASGSIDHFKANQKTYEAVLDHAIGEGYTLIEAGDCEELWFIRDIAAYPRKAGKLDIAKKLEWIIDSHDGVYSRLKTLYDDNRYFRCYGNHDSFLKDTSVLDILKTRMDGNANGPFKIYDAFTIPGVKTMLEHTPGQILGDLADLIDGSKTPTDFASALARGRIGLNALDYTETCTMLVTHGHQFDLWNSPENEIIGLLLSNTIGMFVDRNMDPILDIGGFASQGNPVLEFDSVFAGWPIFSSWLGRGPSLGFAHRLQHMAHSERVLNDDIWYRESYAALYGAFGIALDGLDEHGIRVTPAQSRQNPDMMTTPAGIAEYLRRHHFHHICVGHTHNPHSQPHLTLDDLGELVPPLKPAIQKLRELVPELFNTYVPPQLGMVSEAVQESITDPRIKSNYFNSGTAGWHEGVIWAIIIDGTGQARLAYWTDIANDWEYMGWELAPRDIVQADLLQGAKNALGGPTLELEAATKDVYDRLRTAWKKLGASDGEIAQALSQPGALPIYALAAGLMETAAPAGRAIRELQEVGRGVQEKVEELKRQSDKLRSFIFDVSLSVKRRGLQGFAPGETEEIALRAPISTPDRKRLSQFESVLQKLGLSPAEALQYGALGMRVFDRFPRNLPFSEGLGALNPFRSASEPNAVLKEMLGVLWMFPPAGESFEVGGVRISSEISATDGFFELKVILEGVPVLLS